MPFTYGDPSTSDIWAVRFEIQDTDSSAQLLQDDEVGYAILRETGQAANTGALVLNDYGVFSAAARCCEALSRLFAAQADEQVGDNRTTYSKQAQTYSDRAKELRIKAAGSSPAGPYAGGQSRSEKWGREQDTDAVQPKLRKNQFGNPYGGTGGFDDISPPFGDGPGDC